MGRNVVVVALCALALVACGGSKSEEERVADVTNDYIDAFNGGDYGKVCDLLTTEARVQIAEGSALLRGGGGCEETLEAAVGLSLEKIEVKASDVTVDGDIATVEGANLPGEEGGTRLEKKSGEWYLGPDS